MEEITKDTDGVRTLSTAIARRAIAARHARGLSRRQAASEAGMAATTLLDKELGRHPFTVADLHRLERAYGLRVADLYRTSGPIRFRSSRIPNLTDPAHTVKVSHSDAIATGAAL